MKNKVLTFAICTIVTLFSTYSFAESLTIFSGRKEPLIKPVIKLFEEQSGIKVTLKTGKSTALGQQILQELPNPSADVFIAKESGSLEYLRLKNAFEKYESEGTSRIPRKYKAGDGTWIGVSGRARAMIYNKDLVNESTLPTSLGELMNEQYKGKIAAVNSGNESFVAWISALRIRHGDSWTKHFLNSLKENDIQLITKSHTDIRKAVGRGEYPYGLINHYYYHLQKKEVDESLRNVGIIYLEQGEDHDGAAFNVSGAAIVKGAKNSNAAQSFIDFLASDQAQKLFAEVNYEYPLVNGVASHPDVLNSLNCNGSSAIACLDRLDVNLDQLGEKLESTTELLDEVGWY